MTNFSQSRRSSVKFNLIYLFLVVFMLNTTGQSSVSATGKLIITFTHIRSDVGQIALALYDHKDQWTDNPAMEYAWDKENLKNDRLTVSIKDIPRTIYAIAVLDDENENLEMEYTLGLPTEGWGMSTNPSFFKLTKPGFDEVSFDLDAPTIRMEIKMNYIRKNKKVKN